MKEMYRRLVRILESCPKCKGDGELQCVHADMFRCYKCNGTGKNSFLRVGKVWGVGIAFEIYREQSESGVEKNILACKTYIGPLLFNFKIPLRTYNKINLKK